MGKIKRLKIDYDELLNIKNNYPSKEELIQAISDVINMSYRTDNSIEEFEKAMSVLEKTNNEESFKKLIHFNDGKVDIENKYLLQTEAQLEVLQIDAVDKMECMNFIKEKKTAQDILNIVKDKAVNLVQSMVTTIDTNIKNFTKFASNVNQQIQSNIKELPEEAKTIALESIVTAGKQVTNVGNKINKQIEQTTEKTNSLTNKMKNWLHMAGQGMNIAKQTVVKELLEENISWNKYKIEKETELIESFDRISNKYVNIATGILNTSEAFRNSITALGTELDKKLIEKRYKTSPSNPRFVAAVFKESMLHPTKTNDELINSVKEEFNQRKEMELGGLKKAGEKGPGLFAKSIANMCMAIHTLYEKDPFLAKLKDNAVSRTQTIIENKNRVDELKEDIQDKIDDLCEQR